MTQPSTDFDTPSQQKVFAARLSIMSNALLVLLKLLVGIWSGSISILSEAFHSASDLLASGIALMAVRIAEVPPDDEHPYGHGKAESLSGLAEALLIFVAAGYIFYEAIHKLLTPVHSVHTSVDIGIGVMAFSAILNTFLSRYLFRVAQQTDSVALSADAEHLRTDVYTSVGVLVGLMLVRLTDIAWFDPVTALFVAILILKTTYHLAHKALQLLLDVRLPDSEVQTIREILKSDERVMDFHQLRTRKSGAHRYADVHVLIEDQSTLIEAHDLTEELEDKIRAALSSMHINIHIEPYHAEVEHQRKAHGRYLP
ncbi:MAG: cation diffusion facilitator family transporter [Armatimonadetes bacterium]|nr:cation diffusion facilitator family transporter [Armatimonadota bacterium]